jgi:hypothetical protein
MAYAYQKASWLVPASYVMVDGAVDAERRGARPAGHSATIAPAKM